MCKVDVKESLLVGAPPEKVYAVLAEPEHHRHILPDAFVKYEPQGDSIVSFDLKAGGTIRSFRVRIDLTEPNKLIREINLATGMCTEFRLEPHEQGTIVTIATQYKTAVSLFGVMEALFAPNFLRRLYMEELVMLGRYVLVAAV